MSTPEGRRRCRDRALGAMRLLAVATGLSLLVALPSCSRGRTEHEVAPRASAAPIAPAAVAAPLAHRTATPGEPTRLVHFLGRIDASDPAGPRFAWPGTAIAATFRGTGLDVVLHDSGTNSFAVVVDGGSPTVLWTVAAQDAYTVASGLPPGEHTVVITKRTESSFGTVQYLGIAPHGGSLVPSPVPFSRRIEYVGDSITCGYGDLGTTATCERSAHTDDETIAYGALAAAELDAQATVIAYSGLGVLRDYAGGTTDQMPARFGRTLADDRESVWTFGSAPPDVVIVNLGTNDFIKGDPGPAFSRAYVAFVGRIRAHYPRALIVCALGPMLTDRYSGQRTRAAGYVRAAVGELASAGDARISYFEFDEQEAKDGYGCGQHPSATTHRRDAAKLAAFLRRLTGW